MIAASSRLSPAERHAFSSSATVAFNSVNCAAVMPTIPASVFAGAGSKRCKPGPIEKTLRRGLSGGIDPPSLYARQGRKLALSDPFR
jgi:hypothetical protein